MHTSGRSRPMTYSTVDDLVPRNLPLREVVQDLGTYVVKI